VTDKARIVEHLLRQNAAACEAKLSVFVRCAWHIVEPTTPYLHNWHIDAICEYLEAVSAGQIRRLMVNIPPRMMKSLLCTVFWPCWEWARNPGERMVFSSYNADLSIMHSVARRNIIQSDWYQRRWGARPIALIPPAVLANLGHNNVTADWVKLSADENQKKQFENTLKGRMQTTSTGGTITGIGGNTIVIDDPHSVKTADSDAERKSDVDFCEGTLSTRFDNKKTSRLVCVMQRLHDQDYAGVQLRKGGWEHLCIPNPNDVRRTYILPLSKREITREQGQLMWPEREGEPEIAQVKKDLGSYRFAGQYGQKPAPPEGGIFKRKDIQYYKELPTLDAVIQTWDMSFKDTITSDEVSGLMMGKRGNDQYIFDRIYEHLGFNASKAAAKLWAAGKYQKYTAILIEDKANGTAIIEDLKNTNGLHGVLAVNPEGGKLARAWAAQPTVEAHNVWLPDPTVFPESALWVGDFIDHLCKFPNTTDDHDVDAFTQGVSYLKKYGGAIFAFTANKAAEIKARRESESKTNDGGFNITSKPDK
jgi:predicted phage terminase large subunit-like protein